MYIVSIYIYSVLQWISDRSLHIHIHTCIHHTKHQSTSTQSTTAKSTQHSARVATNYSSFYYTLYYCSLCYHTRICTDLIVFLPTIRCL